ncbi:MAG: TonB-dependent receptor [Gammaproteobacteria bacterium]|nr:TonB-dependent receptor [Gammaproteobacteria bacterium]
MQVTMPLFRQSLLVAVAAGLSLSYSTGFSADVVDASGRPLSEIFVIAQKKGRAENLQEVPAAITAYNEDQLDAIIFQRIDDLSYYVPNVQLEEVGTFPGVQNFSFRGQGINSSIPSVDPTVGTFIDGIYVGTTYGVVMDTWDLESVEILRGPQGLLFGRNVTGGAVLLRTARPDPEGEFQLKARVQSTNENRDGASLAIEAPFIKGVLAGKLMLHYEDDDGYFENRNPYPFPAPAFPSPPFIYFNQEKPCSGPLFERCRDIGRLETKIARPSLVWTPSDTFELALITEFGSLEGDGAPWTVVDGGSGLAGQRDDTGALKEFRTSMDDYGETDIEWKQATVELNWDVGGGTLTSITGYREVEAFATADVDGTGLPIFTAPGNTDQDQVSTELRWTAMINDTWDTTVGFYYLNQDIEYRESRYIQVDLTALPDIVPSPGFLTIALGGDMESDTYGIFWNNDFQLTEEVVMNFGLRYSDEEKDAEIISGPFGGGGGSCADVVTFVCDFDDLDGDWDHWIPKIGFQWNYNDDSQLYGFWTKGYRTGGFNFRNAAPAVIPPGPTEEEEHSNFEIGLKTEFFDNQLRMNLAYFHDEIDDMQRELNIPNPAVIVLQGTVNAGDVTIRGVEAEFQAAPTDYLNFYGTVGYLDGEYDSKNPLPPLAVLYGASVGDDLPRLAQWSYSLGGSWDIPLERGGLVNLRMDYGTRDRNAYDDGNLNYFDRQSRLAASVSWFSPEETWGVTLWGKNLGDEANYGNITSIAGMYDAGPMQRGKEIGVRVEYRL